MRSVASNANYILSINIVSVLLNPQVCNRELDSCTKVVKV